jgi:hypothetical protein
VARRTLDRRKLREDADAVAATEEAVSDEAEVESDNGDGEDEDGDAKPKKKPAKAKKAPAAPRVRKPRAKKPPPIRFARWAVFDGTMKQVAGFDYNQRPAADAKLADLTANRKGVFFLQLVKEAAPAAEPAAVAAE